MHTLSKFIALLLVALLTACGGGGGSPGTVTNSSSTTSSTTTNTTTTGITTTVAVSVADFIFELDKTSIVNTGSDKAVLTVLVVDGNRNVLPNIPVVVSVDAGAVFAAAGAATDASGKFSGSITIGGNKSNRTVNATITINGIVKVASILVTGSQVLVTPVPATPTPGQIVVLNIATLDSAGNPIQSVPVTVTGSAGALTSSATGLSGQLVSSFVAPVTPGSYTVVATALGVSTTKIIQVISAGGGSVPNAVGAVSSASLSPQPTSIAPNLDGSSTNRATLSAKFLTTGNVGITNMRVRFEIVAPRLGNGETISTGDATVYSDVSGTAQADYIAGTRSSPTNGVSVRACYSLVDFVSATDCPNQVAASLTVAGTPLSITVGDDNTMAKGLGGIAYIKQFLIQVNDSAGVSVKDAIVTASVDITHYGKGKFGGIYPFDSVPPTGTNSFASIQSPAGSSLTAAVISTTIAPSVLATGTTTAVFNVWCANEDKNRNGFLDTGEDINGDGVIEPRKAEIIVSYVSGNKTDSNGQLLLQVSFAQNVGSWLSYLLRATTSVAGSEGDASKAYITDVLQADVGNGSFLTPPYGIGACNSPN
jgi:hypothetical protein